MPSDDQAIIDWEFYQQYRTDTLEWRETRDRAEKFRAGAQWSAQTSQDLEDREQVDIVLNKIRPLVDMRCSLMAANKPTGHVFGVHKEDSGNASKLNEFMDWHWYNSTGQIKLLRGIKGQQTTGLHWMFVHSDPTRDFGRGELIITDLSYRNVFHDVGVSEWDFSDAPRIIVTKLTMAEDFYLMNPKISKDEGLLVVDDEIRWEGARQHKQKVEIGVPTSHGTHSGSVMRWIRVLEVYEKVTQNVPVLLQKNTGIPVRVLDEGEEIHPDEKVLLKKNITAEDLQRLGIDPNTDPELVRLEEKEIPIKRIKRRKSASGVLSMKMDGTGKTVEIMPISSYPMKPLIGDDTRNGMPLGEVDQHAGTQELINSFISLTVLNAALGANLRYIIDPTALADSKMTTEKLQQQLSDPGSIIFMRKDPQTGKFPIDTIRPEGLNQAFFSLYQALSGEIESQSSNLQLRSGDPTNAPDTFNATLQLGQWSMDSLRIPLTYMESAIEGLFNVMLEWIPKYYTFEKMYHTVGKHGEPNTLFFNPGDVQESAKAWNTLSTPQNITAYYRIRSGSTMPSQSVAEMNILQQLSQQEPALIGKVVERIPGISDSEKQEIVQTIDQVAQLSQANQSKDQLLNAMQGEVQRLNEQVGALQKKSIMDDFENEAKKKLDDLELEKKLEIVRLQQTSKE